jgi:hypothetical protein
LACGYLKFSNFRSICLQVDNYHLFSSHTLFDDCGCNFPDDDGSGPLSHDDGDEAEASDVFLYNDFDDDFYCCLCYTYDPCALHTAKISHVSFPFKSNGKKKRKWLTFGNRHDAGDGVLVSRRGIG